MTTQLSRLRELAAGVLAQTGPNVTGSAGWFRAAATELAKGMADVLVEVERLREFAVTPTQLAADLDQAVAEESASLRSQLAIVRKQADEMIAERTQAIRERDDALSIERRCLDAQCRQTKALAETESLLNETAKDRDDLIRQGRELRAQLAAITAARDEATAQLAAEIARSHQYVKALDEVCGIAVVALSRLGMIEHPADWQGDLDRIAELRKVGQ